MTALGRPRLQPSGMNRPWYGGRTVATRTKATTTAERGAANGGYSAGAGTGVLRRHAEDQFAEELAALTAADDKPRPPNWRLSPWAVATYVLGGKAGGVEITPKYIGKRRLVEIAIATLATDHALLLL